MKRLVEILNYLKNRYISISYLAFDDATNTVLVFMNFNEEEKAIEIADDKFSFYNEQLTEFNHYTTEQIIEFLDNNL